MLIRIPHGQNKAMQARNPAERLPLGARVVPTTGRGAREPHSDQERADDDRNHTRWSTRDLQPPQPTCHPLCAGAAFHAADNGCVRRSAWFRRDLPGSAGVRRWKQKDDHGRPPAVEGGELRTRKSQAEHWPQRLTDRRHARSFVAICSLAVVCVLAVLGSGCGEELSASDLAKLPQSVDLRRLAGAKLSDTVCTFGEPGRVDGPRSGRSLIYLVCVPSEIRHLSGTVVVTTASTGEERAEDAVYCREERSAEFCVLRHGMITVETLAGCLGGSCSARDASRGLMARIVERLATLPEERCPLCPRFYQPERPT